MKIKNILNWTLLTLFTFPFLQNCEKNDLFPLNYYHCGHNFGDSSNIHPKAITYQAILDENRKKGLVGAVLLVKDRNGLWIGASGKSDIASNINVKPCNTFLIASISKVFTAVAVYKYIDRGLLSLEDPITKWLPKNITGKVKNAKKTKISHLLSHTSGIADIYTTQMELDRINRINNNWTKMELLTYIYGKKPTNAVGEKYYYSNTNYLILSIILENVSGKSFKQVYQDEIFDPLQLASAYYDEEQPIPPGCVKGYADIYGNGQFAESRFLYEDELGVGGDGGIAINAYDLAQFLEKLGKGELISEDSYNAMTNWFDLPDDWIWDTYGQTENGFGIEKFNTSYGYAIGHTGGIDGFSSKGFYFPDHDLTFILLVNSVGQKQDAQDAIFKSILIEMFN